MDKMIPSRLYKKIVESVPIVCVDIIIKHGKKFLLVQRKNEPLKGQWWLVGGRALKNEKTKEAARRKIKEEIGLEPLSLWRVGIYEDSYPQSAFGVPTSSVSIVYFAQIDNLEKIKLDNTSSKFMLSPTLPARFLKHYEKN